jgi:hypothetical protein
MYRAITIAGELGYMNLADGKHTVGIALGEQLLFL